ncbi:MAG: hypothetical protein EOM77_02900 [Bacteroidia bacterium]|nr:hypothetical protein [Bacteroidia bacterium]
MIFLIENAFNEFLKDNAVWIALFFFSLIVLTLIIIFASNRKKTSAKTLSTLNSDAILSALGGKENLISIDAKGSRLFVSVKQKSLLNKEGLKVAGVTSIIEMSDKYILVFNISAETIRSKISLL